VFLDFLIYPMSLEEKCTLFSTADFYQKKRESYFPETMRFGAFENKLKRATETCPFSCLNFST